MMPYPSYKETPFKEVTMKKKPSLIIIIMFTIVFSILTNPAMAQLGDVDNSSFIIQNVGSGQATVVVTFYDEAGNGITPNPLNSGKPNPFTLDPGASFEVYLPGIPGLPNGRYSVAVSSDQPVVAIANLIGQNTAGTVFYNGSYAGASEGATTIYLPAIVRAYYGWNSLISVQNVGSSPTDVTVTYTCGSNTYTHTKTGLQPNASVHFDLETNPPSGMPTGCNGSAVVTSTGQPIIAVDNQTAAGQGLTQSYNGFVRGATTVYVPALYHDYYTWSSSLNIRKIGSGTTSVIVTYSDGGTSTCNLTDATPSCMLYMPTAHPAKGRFAATITSTSLPIVAIVNAANPNKQAQTYEGFTDGKSSVGLPTVMKKYYGWDTSFTCQNVGSVATVLNIVYQGYAAKAYDTKSLNPGESIEIYQPAETFLPNGYRGSVTVTAKATGAKIACIVNQTHGANQAAGKGDWSMSYNAP
jgi:hypothetical protein